MFHRTSALFAVSACAVLAAASPADKRWDPVTTTVTVTAPASTATGTPAGNCSTGTLQCCNTVGTVRSTSYVRVSTIDPLVNDRQTNSE